MKTASPRDAFPAPEHDHVACRDATLNRAREAFDARGLKLTDLRAQVFGEIAASHHAIGAYDIIDRLARQGTRIAPISVYRAIDVLLAAGVVHRLESRNAFFACHASHSADRQHVILACATCGIVAEVAASAIFDAIDTAARSARFEPQTRMVEVSGLCAHCRQTVASAP
ncbi:MAG: Fur family transcriptional regulator [Hyphomicrobium aestuarii]|nr:Fur family transcriptional regulator [Hyphomicrobium aestuarii]